MATPKVSEKMQGLGKQLLEALDTTQDRPQSMFWFYTSQLGWVLYIAIPKFNPNNFQQEEEISQRITDIASSLSHDNITFALIHIHDTMTLAMSNMFQTEPDLVGQVTIMDSMVDNFMIKARLSTDYL